MLQLYLHGIVMPGATDSRCPWHMNSHLHRGQERPVQLPGMLFLKRNAIDSGYSCTQHSDLRLDLKGPEHILDVLVTPCSVESCRPCAWRLHLRHAQEGPEQLLNTLAMPVKSSYPCLVICICAMLEKD